MSSSSSVTVSPSPLQSTISQILDQFGSGNVTSSNWSTVLITVMGLIDSNFSTLEGADKQSVAIAVLSQLVKSSSLSPAEQMILEQLIQNGAATLINEVVSVSKGLSSINVRGFFQKLCSCCPCCTRTVKTIKKA